MSWGSGQATRAKGVSTVALSPRTRLLSPPAQSSRHVTITRQRQQPGTGRPVNFSLWRLLRRISGGPVTCRVQRCIAAHAPSIAVRSEEHTSELQSLAYLVCRLLLEKKKKI